MNFKSFLAARRPAILRAATSLAAVALLLCAPAAKAVGGITVSPAVIQFPSTAVGVQVGPVTATFTVTGLTGSFFGNTHYGTDFFLGSTNCTTSGSNQTCTIAVYFRPTLPGVRKDAIFFTNGTNRFIAYLSGVGTAPLAAFQPGILTQPTGYASLVGGLADQTPVDEVYGLTYFSNNGNIYSCNSNCSTSPALLVTGAGNISTLAIDGAGILYWGAPSGSTTPTTTINTYDTVLNVKSTVTMPASDIYFNVAVDGMGDVFAVGSTSQNIYEVTPTGTSTSVAINPAVTSGTRSAVDPAGDFFLGGTIINELTVGGTQTQISTVSVTGGLAVDAAGTLYGAANPPFELAPGSYGSVSYTYPGLTGINVSGLSLSTNGDITVGAMGTTYIIDRSRGAMAFGAQTVNTTSSTLTVNMINVGNTPLTLTNIALTGTGYTLQTAATAPCTAGIVLAPAASCNFAANFNAANPGNYPGTIVATSNSLNNTSSTETITLSAFIHGPYLTTSTTALNFGTQTINVNSPAQSVTVTNNGYDAALSLSLLSSNPAFTPSAGTCTGALAAGASCTFNVTFDPLIPQSYSGNITATAVGTPYANSSVVLPATGIGLPVVVETAGGTNNSVIFASTAVGIAPGSAPTTTATFTLSGYTTQPASMTAAMHYGTSFTAGTLACTGGPATLTCSIPVTFVPQYPGARRDAIIVSVNGLPAATIQVYGVGTAPLVLVQPGVITTPIHLTAGYYYNSVVGEDGTVYVVGSNTSTAYSITKAGVVTKLPIQFGNLQPQGIAVDGAGTLYITVGDYSQNIITYTAAGVQGTRSLIVPTGYTPCSNLFGLYGIVAGIGGDLYTFDNVCNILYSQKRDGTATATTISPAITQPSQLALDASENVFVSGYAINEVPASGTQTQITTYGSTEGIGIDAANTVYVARYSNNSVSYAIGMIPASGYNAPLAGLDAGGAITGNPSLAPDGTVYIGDYTSVDKVDRSQGLFTFNALNPNQVATAQIAQVYNGGNAPLTLTSFTLTGDPGYTLTANSCTNGLVIQPGALCSITVNFTAPAHGGTFAGNIALVTNSLNTTTNSNIALSDIVANPYVTVLPTSLAFAPQAVGTTSAAQTVTFTNMGAGTVNANLYFFEATLSGSPTTVFTVTGGSGCNSIPVGGSCTASVTFTPAAATAYTATGDAFLSGGTPSPVTFALTGTGAAPAVTFSPTSVSFSPQGTGSTSAPTVVKLTNSGTSPLSISAITLAGGYSAYFAQTNNCPISPATLAASAFCSISVTFTPGSQVTYVGETISVADNISGSPQTVALSGTGVAPTLSIVPATLNYAATVGTTSPSQYFLITNLSANPISLSLALTGTNAANFTQTATTCTSTLAEGGNCTATITFTPPSTGAYNATFSASYGTGAVSAPITGTGNAFVPTPQLQFTPSALTAFAGTGATCSRAELTAGIGDGGPATAGSLCTAFATSVDPSGNVYIADFSFNDVRKVSAGTISTAAGIAAINGAFSGDGGPAPAAGLYQPADVITDAQGNLYIVDSSNYRIRKVTAATGNISTLYGPTIGYYNGSLSSLPVGQGTIAFDPSGNLYFAGGYSQLVIKVTPAGSASIFAGSQSNSGPGLGGYTGDGGPAYLAKLNNPQGVASDLAGNIYIADTNNNVIRMVSAATGIITTIAGNGTLGYSGDGGPATSASLTAGYLSTDLAGDIYVTGLTGQQGNPGTFSVVRKITPAGIISTYAGGGTTGVGTAAATASLGGSLIGVARVDLNGTLIIPDNTLVYSAGNNGLLAFGSQTVNTSTTQTLTIENTGNTPLVFNSTPYTLTGSSTFTVTSSTCTGSLAIAATCAVQVQFTPTTTAPVTAALAFASNAQGGVETASLTGSGTSPTAPIFNFTPTGIAFGNQIVNTTSAVFTASINNTGSGALNLSNIALTGTNAANFTLVTASTSPCGTTIAPQTYCNLAATFTPTAITSYSAGITVTDNASGSPQTLPLTGAGIAAPAPQANLTPAFLTFNGTTINTTAPTQTLTFTNTGTATLSIASVALSGTNSGSFALNNSCGSSLGVGGTCTIIVSFTPLATGTLGATLTITDNSGGTAGTTQTAILSGTGNAPQAALTASLAFPSTTINTTAAAMTATLTNAGGVALPITSAVASAQFAITANTCGSSLAAGASCTYSITFTPTATGAQSGTLTVVDSVGTQTTALTGTGAAGPTPQAALTASLVFPSTTINTTAAAMTATLTNAGTAALPITSASASGPFALTANTCGSSLAIGASCSYSITFTPTTIGAQTGALTVVDSVGTQTTTLTGTATAVPAPLAALTASLAFPSTVINTTATAMSATLTNAGTAILPINSASASGPFALTANTCGSSLAIGASCTYTITFTPTTTGAQTGALTVVDSVGTQTTTLTGTGAPVPVAQAVLSPTSLTFPSTFMGTPSVAQVITLSNPGTATLTGIALSFTGANPTSYSETTTCGTTLAAAASCSISITFTPAAASTYTANLSVANSIATQTATLTGSGNSSTGFTVVSPTPTQSVDPGGVAVYNINVNTLTGNYTLPVTLTASGLPTGATYSFAPASVVPGTTGAPSVLTIQTSASFALSKPLSLPIYAVLLFLPLAGLRRVRSKFRALSPALRLLTLALISLAAILPLSGCGGGGYFGAAPQAYTITVTGTSTVATQSTTVTLNLQ